MPEPQTWTSVILPSLALIAVITFGVLNLRRASRGPDGSPAWTVEHINKARYQLVQTGTANATDVQIEFVPDNNGVRIARATFDVFSRGQREDFMAPSSWGSEPTRIVVTWARKGADRGRFESALP